MRESQSEQGGSTHFYLCSASPQKEATLRNIKINEPLTADDMRVLSVKEWARLNGLSTITGKRLIAAGEGPQVFQLSKRRVGIRMAEPRELDSQGDELYRKGRWHRASTGTLLNG